VERVQAHAVIRDVSKWVRTIELAWIPMPDGRRLAARLRGERCFSRSFAHKIARDNL